MKKQILATLVLVISAFATATASGKGETDCSSSKKITVNKTTGFSKLVVDGNVDVVLFEDNAESEIRTFGNNADLASTSISQKNGVLTIKNNNANGPKVLVYVPVSHLAIIEANGNSKVSSASPLQSKQLTLVVKGDCKFNIQATGDIDIVQDGAEEVRVEKNIAAVKLTPQS